MIITDKYVVNNLFGLRRANNNCAQSFGVRYRGLTKDTVEITNPYIQETEYGTITRLANGHLNELIFQKPVSLEMAFHIVKKTNEKYNICHNGKSTENRLNCLSNVEFFDKFNDMKFTKFVGAGSKIYAFETEDGNVLKLSVVPHFKYRENVEDFDAPILESGNLDNEFFYYIQKKCSKEGITQKDLDEMELRLQFQGYNFVDMGVGQIGRGDDGKIYLIDYECAVPSKDDLDCMLVYL